MQMNHIDNNIYEHLKLLPIDLQGWNGTSDIFNTLIEQTKPSVIIEVGSWKGQSAITMANCIKAHNLQTRIYCVDTWLGALEFWDDLNDTPERDLKLKNGYPQIYYQFLSNIVHSNVQDIILPFPTTSTIGFRYFQKKGITPQLVYIDASHDKEDVYIDIRNYYSILSSGGILFGDDYIAWPGVSEAVQQFSSETGVSFNVLQNNFWTITK